MRKENLMSDAHPAPNTEMMELEQKLKVKVAFQWLQVLACVVVLLGVAWALILGPIFSMAMQKPLAIVMVVIASAVAFSIVIIAIAYAERVRNP